MKLYVANLTNQMQILMFRLPEKKHAIIATIDIGRQGIVGAREMSRPEIDAITEQIETYGARSVASFKNAREGGRPYPTLWSVDEPVPVAVMQEGAQWNAGIKTAEGKKFREEAAVAASNGMRDMSPNAANNLQMSVQEETAGNYDTGYHVSEGVRIDPTMV